MRPHPDTSRGPLALIIDNSWPASHQWRQREEAIAEAIASAAENQRPIFFLETAPEASLIGPLSPIQARQEASKLRPQPFLSDRENAIRQLNALDSYANDQKIEFRWLSDGIAGAHDDTFAKALKKRGDVQVLAPDLETVPFLRPDAGDPNQRGANFKIERLAAGDEWSGSAVVIARDGRQLDRIQIDLSNTETSKIFSIDLPLALRNEIASVRLEGESSPGAIHLVDARRRRALIGIPGVEDGLATELLSGAHYIEQALKTHAEFVRGTIESITESDASVIILDDVGKLRISDAALLGEWVENGGVLIRFAGAKLAEATQDATPALMPIRLRGGGRAFGGALTWDTPQSLGAFAPDGPFGDLSPPADVKIRRQVLAEPGGETTNRTWAQLADGTPLVTGAPLGKGAIALFHVTATPDWSDLPISVTFIDMLRALTFLSVLGPEAAETGETARYAPLRLMDGYGRLEKPGADDLAQSAAALNGAPEPGMRPGYYGPPEAPLALNAFGQNDVLKPMSNLGLPIAPYRATPPTSLAPPLIIAGVALLLIDGFVSLLLSGGLPFRRAAALICIGVTASVAPFHDLKAQPLDPEISQDALDAALSTRLAYIKSGDPGLDRLSAQALSGLSRELARRTAIEPAPVASVDPETDDLSVYPFLYWPLSPDQAAVSEAAISNLENFMRSGGLVVFDTRDDERAIGGAQTPERAALQQLLSELDIPPLAPVKSGHVLTRSFYLLNDLPGRLSGNQVWIQDGAGGSSNDGVTPLIISGRDWAGAWAADSFGRPVRPMGRGGERARELAYRAGVNMVMVALTGNYKADQVHTPILLERLGR